MTGGFQCFIRGRRIDVSKTMDNFATKDEDFIQYLSRIGLNSWNYKNIKLLGKQQPNTNGLVILIEDEYFEIESAFMATGIWEYQNWVDQEWNKKDLKSIIKFLDPKNLDVEINSGLDENFVIDSNKSQKMHSIPCEVFYIYH